MKKHIGMMAISLSLVIALSLTVQAADKQPEWSTLLKREGAVVNGDYDGNFSVPKDKYNPDDLNTYSFTSKTTFEGSEKKAQKILEAAKNPGLGVRKLHEQGITGKGVNIAYIGYGIPGGNVKSVTHPEFRDGMIKQYISIGNSHRKMKFETYMDISALTGKTVGTAPDVNLYWVGVGTDGNWRKNFITGIDWIIEKNKTLPKADKIRIIVGASEMTDALMNPGKVEPYLNLYLETVRRAEDSGIIFLGNHASGYASEFNDGLHPQRGRYDPSNPDDVSKAKRYNYTEEDWGTGPRFIHAATSRRTYAGIDNTYIYNFGTSEESYIAGIIAMGYQANPNISSAKITKIMLDTRNSEGVVNPPKFIEAVKKTIK